MAEIKTAPLVATHVADKETFLRDRVAGSFRAGPADSDGELSFWYCCPCGCGAVAVRAERDRLKQAVAQKDDEIKVATEARTKAEAELRRNKTRIAKGVCTCCNRTFANLQRHMATKHPEQTGARN